MGKGYLQESSKQGAPCRFWGGPAWPSRQVLELGAEQCQWGLPAAWGQGQRWLRRHFASSPGAPHGLGSTKGTRIPLHIIRPPSCAQTRPCADVQTYPRCVHPAPDVHSHPCRCAHPPPRCAHTPAYVHPPRRALALPCADVTTPRSPCTAWGQPPPKGQGMLVAPTQGTGAEAVSWVPALIPPAVSAHESRLHPPLHSLAQRALVLITPWFLFDFITGQQERKGDFSLLAIPQKNCVCLLNCGQTSTLRKKMTQWELWRHLDLPVKPCQPGGEPWQAAEPPGAHTAPALEAAG